MQICLRSFLIIFFLDHLASSISLHPLWRSSISPLHHWSHLDNPGVDPAANAVLHLDIQLRDNILLKSPIFLQIFLWWCINDIPDGESLDGLILGAEPATVHAHDGLNVTPVVFIPSLISSLLRHCGYKLILYLIKKLNISSFNQPQSSPYPHQYQF